jgi:hypothetical protein
MVLLEPLKDLVIGLELVQVLTMLIMLGGRMENLVILMNRIFSLAHNYKFPQFNEWALLLPVIWQHNSI